MKNSQEYQQAVAQRAEIRRMVAALNVDYDRLEELREYRENDELDTDELEELAELEQQAGDCCDYDDAQERIQEDALSVEVRSGWQCPFTELEPEEFCILLCTGGPAVRIRGELDQYARPDSAVIEYQGWGTPWTELPNRTGDEEFLLEYCGQFHFSV